ncbi:pyridine nucleotide-disulfide oxidoreductase [Gordonia rubripertincta]|uniref:Pyridine nucleotide-disulfide oxidoreductase n=1 Tax=Gordonia rubripertincta TaxID=36822 RepID=A0AAW4G744_GORRU|nr:pyridine nucleotide-disulfide oxidoreductase [Gordonia rubripertincta]MBM7279527.1 pyridine nucleotide-disulfide oxidoreductase [Gordonia rubripertincta]
MTAPEVVRQHGRAVVVVAAIVACAALFVLGACSSVDRVTNNVSKPADVAIGQCVQVRSADGDQANVEATKAECDADGMTFIASQVVPGECDAFENYLTFPDTSDRLCLMPNFVQGQCYEIPQSAGGSLVDFKQVDCTAEAGAESVVYRVETVGDGSMECAENQVKATYEKPEPRVFCLASLSGA